LVLSLCRRAKAQAVSTMAKEGEHILVLRRSHSRKKDTLAA
jgi:hypothetical protein